MDNKRTMYWRWKKRKRCTKAKIAFVARSAVLKRCVQCCEARFSRMRNYLHTTVEFGSGPVIKVRIWFRIWFRFGFAENYVLHILTLILLIFYSRWRLLLNKKGKIDCHAFWLHDGSKSGSGSGKIFRTHSTGCFSQVIKKVACSLSTHMRDGGTHLKQCQWSQTKRIFSHAKMNNMVFLGWINLFIRFVVNITSTEKVTWKISFELQPLSWSF